MIWVLLRILNAAASLLMGNMIVLGTVAALMGFIWLPFSHSIFLVFYIPPLPSIEDFIYWVVMYSLFMLAIQTLLFLAIPLKRQMRFAFGQSPTMAAEKNSDVWFFVNSMAKSMGQKPVKVFVVDLNYPGAFCITSLFGSAVALTTSLLTNLQRDEIEWVVAHELIHRKSRDGVGNAAWLAACRILNLDLVLHRWTIQLICEFLNVLNIPAWLGYLILAPLAVLFITMRAVEKVTRTLYLLIDRMLGRFIEYRCDKEAAQATSSDAGVRALKILSNGVEPPFRIFSTHPVTHKRIESMVDHVPITPLRAHAQ